MKNSLQGLALASVAALSSAAPAEDLSAEAKQAATTAATISHKAERAGYAAPAEHFTGHALVEPQFSADAPARSSAADVTFQPRARTDWHVHPLGQTLIVTAGVGVVQLWGGQAQRIVPGDVVWIPPGQKHWHGATRDSAMTHTAVQAPLEGKTVDWLEKVGDDAYGAAEQQLRSASMAAAAHGASASRAQQLMGDIAPKLAQLTDDVLFGDVWERPGLSKRDRSLATVAALIAMNRPEQLRSHLALARQNGVTQAELVEVITHLAFYAGWPAAVGATGVAREVFRQP